MYTFIVFALEQDTFTLENSSLGFKRLVSTMFCKKSSSTARAKKKHQSMVRFALRRVSRIVHHSPIEYNIIPSMRGELDVFQKTLEPASGVELKSLIVYLIKKTPVAIADKRKNSSQLLFWDL